MSRILVGRIHLVAGLLAFALIATFWTSTVVSELFLGAAAVAAVKQAILWGMLLLIPAMAAVGGTGFRLGGKSKAPVIARKRRRMPVIALNGILILVPSAFFLAARAERRPVRHGVLRRAGGRACRRRGQHRADEPQHARRLRHDPETARQASAPRTAGGLSLPAQSGLPKNARIAATSGARDGEIELADGGAVGPLKFCLALLGHRREALVERG